MRSVLGQLLRACRRIQKGAVRQGNNHHQHRGRQKEDKGPENDHGDAPVTPRLFEFAGVFYYLPRLFDFCLCRASGIPSRGRGILSKGRGARPAWSGFLANTRSSIIP